MNARPEYRFWLMLDTGAPNLYQRGDTPYILNYNTGAVTRFPILLNYVTPPIPVEAGRHLWVKYLRSVAFYDAAGNFISGTGFGDSDNPWRPTEYVGGGYIEVPANAATMRLYNPSANSEGQPDEASTQEVVYVDVEAARPLYNADMSLIYEKEGDNLFFRPKLSGKMTFIGRDYKRIVDAPIETRYILIIEGRRDSASAWSEMHRAQFSITDCSVDVDAQTVEVSPTPLDAYGDVLDGMEVEQNLADLGVETLPVEITRRPIIQAYVYGAPVLTNYLSAQYWEQEVENTSATHAQLKNTYHFALDSKIKRIELTAASPEYSAVTGTYTGRITTDNGNTFKGYLTDPKNAQYRIYCSYNNTDNDATYSLQELRGTTWTELSSHGVATDSDNRDIYFNIEPDDSTIAVIIANGTLKGWPIYVRLLLNAATFNGASTYALPANDIVDSNKNYTRVAPIYLSGTGYGFASFEFSDTPTPWGSPSEGKYFTKPLLVGLPYPLYPLAPSTWTDVSLWFYAYNLQGFDNAGTAYELRDAYTVADVLSALLAQVAPDVRHEATPEYSEFLYGDTNPVTQGTAFRLLMTQKTNITRGPYDVPAQKVPATLQQVLNMLRDVYRCYWFIDDNHRLRIEHISWFANGGGYNTARVVGYDLTTLRNIRNGKPWCYGRTAYKFNKIQMPARYEFEWMDEVTEVFRGRSLEVMSRYVQRDKVEKINISNFTSDIDYVMENPAEISPDGFMLLAATAKNGISVPSYPSYVAATATAGATYTSLIPLTGGQGKRAKVEVRAQNLEPVSYRITFYDGTTYTAVGSVLSGNEWQSVEVTIPANAQALCFKVGGADTVNLQVRGVFIEGAYVLPFVQVGELTVQNGFAAFDYIVPNIWTYEMPARNLAQGGNRFTANSISKEKTQNISFPVDLGYVDINNLVKTPLGAGQISKMDVNLCSWMAAATLQYGTDE